MKRKYAIMGLVLALSIMATTVANAQYYSLSVTKEKGKYSVWSVKALNHGPITRVYFQYVIVHGGVQLPGTPEVDLMGYFVDNSDLDNIVLVFEIKDLNDILDEEKEGLDPGYKINIVFTAVKFIDSDGIEQTARGPAWRRRSGGW